MAQVNHLRVGNGSSSAIKLIQRYNVEFTAPVLTSGISGSLATTHTVSGLSTGTVLIFTPVNPINTLYNVRARCSTANELVLNWTHNGISTLGSGESTNHGTVLQFSF